MVTVDLETEPVIDSVTVRPDVDFAQAQSLGARQAQEDYSRWQVGSGNGHLLAVLADGMGGHNAGDVASKLAVDAFVHTFGQYPAGAVSAAMGASLQMANHEIAQAISHDEALEEMGCTLVAVHVDRAGLQWISVGDSPLFLLRGRCLIRLNEDHSMMPIIEAARRAGKLSQAEAESHPGRHGLRCAVTGEAFSLVDVSAKPLPLRKDDIVLLASDGLLTLTVREIRAVVRRARKGTAAHMVQALLDAVAEKKKAKQDNTTVQVFVAPEDLGPSRHGLNRWRTLMWVVLLLGAFVAGASSSRLNLREAFSWVHEWIPSADVTPSAPHPVSVPSDEREPPPGAGAAPSTTGAPDESKTEPKAAPEGAVTEKSANGDKGRKGDVSPASPSQPAKRSKH
jgi:protein phosphatase